MPLSVVVTCYNNSAYISETLAGVLAQTAAPLEVIIVDDASTDDSMSIIRGMVGHDSRFRIVPLPENRGSGNARNTGIRAARSEWVALCDGDDIWLPHHLEVLGSLVSRAEGCALAYTRVRAFGSRNYDWEMLVSAGNPTSGFLPSIAQCISQTSSMALHRERFLAVGGYDPDYRACQDFEMSLRLTFRYSVLCTDEITVRYRKHNEGVSRKLLECRMYEYRARTKLLSSLPDDIAPDLRGKIGAAMCNAIDSRFWEAWYARNAVLMKFYRHLSRSIPGSAAIRRRWWPRLVYLQTVQPLLDWWRRHARRDDAA